MVAFRLIAGPDGEVCRGGVAVDGGVDLITGKGGVCRDVGVGVEFQVALSIRSSASPSMAPERRMDRSAEAWSDTSVRGRRAGRSPEGLNSEAVTVPSTLTGAEGSRALCQHRCRCCRLW